MIDLILIYILGFVSPIALVLLLLGGDELRQVYGQYLWRKNRIWGKTITDVKSSYGDKVLVAKPMPKGSVPIVPLELIQKPRLRG